MPESTMKILVFVAPAIIMALVIYQILKVIARSQWVNKGNPVPALKIGAISQQEIINELAALRGRRIALYYEKSVDSAGKAYEIVSHMLEKVGTQSVDSFDDAELVVRIYAGKSHPFAYTITGPPGHSKRYGIEGECVPHLLTPAILLGICYLLKRFSAERGGYEPNI
jgi:hypothetical protein